MNQRSMERAPPSSPIKVGFCLHAMQVAGAEVLVSQIIDRLASWIDPTIYCLDSIGKLGEELRTRGVPVVVLDRRPGFDSRVLRRLGEDMRHRGIEVLHAHQYTPFFYAALAKWRFSRATKILLTEHGRHFPDVVSWKRRWVNRLFLRSAASHSTACCRFSAQALEKVDGFRNVEVLYNGIDPTSHPPRPSDAERQRNRQSLGMQRELQYIVCIARFHPVKDHATLVKAFAIVRSRLPHARLVLVGEGEQRPAIESLCQTLGCREQTEFWGLRRDISAILQASDLFALTSLSEAASITLLEAMANECAVAVTDVGGNGEHVRHEVEGLLSPRGDSQTLARNLERLLRDEPLRVEMGKRGRQRVLQEFSLPHAIDRYKHWYQQLAQR
jgi:L-malate glycosyltransferase